MNCDPIILHLYTASHAGSTGDEPSAVLARFLHLVREREAGRLDPASLANDDFIGFETAARDWFTTCLETLQQGDDHCALRLQALASDDHPDITGQNKRHALTIHRLPILLQVVIDGRHVDDLLPWEVTADRFPPHPLYSDAHTLSIAGERFTLQAGEVASLCAWGPAASQCWHDLELLLAQP